MAAPAAAGAAAKAAKAAGALKKGAAARGMGGGGRQSRDNGEPDRLTKLLVVAAGLFGTGVVAMVLIAAILGTAEQECGTTTASLDGVNEEGALPFLEIYADAAAVYKVNPFLLMAVHEDESTYSSKSQGVQTGVNTFGCCAGPMQFFIGSAATPEQGGRGMTWEGYRNAYQKAKLPRPSSYPNHFAAPKYATPNVYDSYDAIYAAAMYFSALGAGPQLDQRTLDALTSYKGTPPASIPFAKRDYRRAKALERKAKQQTGRNVASTAISALGVAATKKARAEDGGGDSEILLMPVTGSIVSPFGPRWGKIHEGIDIASPAGTPIKAAASGIVSMQGVVGGYGNYVCIRHSAKLTTCYAHLSAYGRFSTGNTIARGDVLGYVGCTGHCYGDHLHFETRAGSEPGSPAVDPMAYLGKDVSTDGSGGTAAGEVCDVLSGAFAQEGAEYAWPVNGGTVSQRSNQKGGSHDPGAGPNNWQSDNALDIGVAYGSEVYAADDGTISRTAGFGDTLRGGAFAGVRFTLEVSGNRIFYHHLSRLAEGIKPGAKVRRGQILGWSGAANGVDHLHIAVERGRPEVLFGLQGGARVKVEEGDTVLYVGDSLGVGTAPQLKRLRPRLRIIVNVRGGRPSSEGVDVLSRRFNPAHKAVIFDLGTNDGSAAELRASLTRAGRIAASRPLIIATLNGPRAGSKNDVIRSFAAGDPSTVVIPWATAGRELFQPDRIHATPDGYVRRAQMLSEVLR